MLIIGETEPGRKEVSGTLLYYLPNFLYTHNCSKIESITFLKRSNNSKWKGGAPSEVFQRLSGLSLLLHQAQGVLHNSTSPSVHGPPLPLQCSWTEALRLHQGFWVFARLSWPERNIVFPLPGLQMFWKSFCRLQFGNTEEWYQPTAPASEHHLLCFWQDLFPVSLLY